MTSSRAKHQTIPRRMLGNTGLSVPILGFGCAPLASVYGAVTEEEGIKSVHLALEMGLNFFDVSPFYGITKGETILGKALKSSGVSRDRYIIATKVGRYGDSDFDFSAATVTKEFEKSLQRLGTDYVDILHCHDIEFGDLDMVVNETIPALRQLQRQGKCKFIGVTGFPLKIFDYIVEHTDIDCLLSYGHYSLNNSSLQEVLPAFKEKGIGIISAAALSQGLLSYKGPPEWLPCSPELKETCKKAVDYCKSKGTDISKLALQFAVENSDVACTFVGISSREELEKNVKWINEPIDRQLLKEVLEILKPVHNQAWTTGKPENN